MRRWVWAVILIAAATAGWFVWWLSNRPLAASRLGGYVPSSATELFVDVDQLRRGGILKRISGSSDEFDLEYRGFLKETGFDFSRDLDQVRASFSDDARYFVLSGRFHWDKVSAYARKRSGSCRGRTCEWSESGEQFRVSNLRQNTLGISLGRTARPFIYRERIDPVSGAPVWVSTSGRQLVMSRFWPAPLSGPIAEVMASATTVRFRAEAWQVKMEAVFPDSGRARAAASMLQSLIEAARQQKDASLAKVASGAKVNQRETSLEASILLDLP